MPRDGSGVYTLPAGNPVVTNTVIASSWANSTLSDIAAQLNNVFTRDGLLGPTGPFKLMDGTVNAPGLAWNSEPGLGWYRLGASVIGMAAQGQRTFAFDASSATLASLIVNPRAAGATAIYLQSGPSAAASANLQLSAGAVNGSVVMRDAAGAATTLPILYTASTHTFTGSGSFTGNLYAPSFTAVGGDWGVSGDANVLYNQFAAGWYWQYTKATGQLAWVRYTGSPTTIFSPNGTLYAGRDIYTGDAQPGTRVGLVGSAAGYPHISFSAAGPRLQYDEGQNWFQFVGTSAVIMTLNNVGDLNVVRSISAGGEISTYNGDGGPSMFFDGGNANYLGMQRRGSTWAWQWDRSSGNLTWLGGSSNNLVQFTNDGNAGKTAGGTAWFTLSDKRAKKDIVDWDGGLEKVLSLRVREFTRIDTGEHCIGCVADEAEVGFPDLIKRAPGKIGEAEYDDVATLHIDPLYWAIVNAIKTLHERINQLETV